jgi:hypothetical protein
MWEAISALPLFSGRFKNVERYLLCIANFS